LKIRKGEWVALVGANGSGKTTLARHLNGLFTPTVGRVLVQGLDSMDRRNLPRIRALVGMVFQSPEDQIVSSLVREDTAFGPENLGIPAEEIHKRVEEALNRVGMWEQRDRPPHLLSAGQIQRVAMAGVLAMQPRCIIFDETTAMLDPIGKRDVLEQMRELHAQGITVVMITHSMEEVAFADRAVLLHEGHLQFDGSPAELFARSDLLTACHLEPPPAVLAAQILSRHFAGITFSAMTVTDLLKALPQNRAGSPFFTQNPSLPPLTAEAMIVVDGLEHVYMSGTPLAHQAIENVSFSSHKGCAHGLVGATGSGKSTLLQHLNGLYLPQKGLVTVGPYSLNDAKVDIRGLRRFAGLVFQNPEAYFFEQYVGDEIAYGPKLLHGREGLRERVSRAMGWVGLDFEKFKDRFTSTLSGGEKRKVALASALAMEPGLLILDEPTAGLDPYSRNNLLKTLKQLQGHGMEIMLSSHNMEDIAALTRQMTVLAHGKSLQTGASAALFTDASLLSQAGLIAPAAVRVAQRLREMGWPLDGSVLTLAQLDAALQALNNARPA
jgi:energy-coupling factor transport system ATP-binding protein